MIIGATTRISQLRVQHTIEPLAIEDRQPMFSWQMVSDERGQQQKAYQISVTDKVSGREVWNSRKVVSSQSDNIRYAGTALQPETFYEWSVTVWDAHNKRHRQKSSFATGLMNTQPLAWEGAEWIGSKANRLSAPSDYYFSINTAFQLVKGSQVSFILGANDFRLNDAFQNIDNMQGENYVRVEIDFSGVGTERGAVLNVYRVGYAPGDKADKPLFSVCKANYPQTNINELLTKENMRQKHTLSMRVETSNLSFQIDGTGLIAQPYEVPFYFKLMGMEADSASPLAVGQYGNTHDFNSFPNLCNIGFAAMPESKVVLSDYSITNRGRSEDNVVFAQEQYDRFNQIPCTRVEGKNIIIDNPGKTMRMGYVDPSHGALTMVRSDFKTAKAVRSAKLYVTAMGAYEMYINGKRVGEDWFAPGDSQFREVLGYNAYDVTHLLTVGQNAIGALLIPGWHTGFMTYITMNFNFWGDHEALKAKLVINYQDGSREVVVTDPNTWRKFDDGPWRYGNFYNGECYDATKEVSVSNWATPTYDQSRWTQADIIAMRSWMNPMIEARYDSPVRVRQTLDAHRVMPVHSNDQHTYTYDMGVNMVGVPQVTIPAGWLQKGDTVIIRYGEQLYPGFDGDEPYYVKTYGKQGKNIAGRILQANLRAALVTDFYIANGAEEVTYIPRTTYRGYQFVQITLPSHTGALPLANIKGLVLSSDSLPTGTYTAKTYDGRTGELVNQLFKNIQRSQMGNFFTIPTDCPQRNERMGWTGDAQAYSRTATYHSDVYNFFRQWMRSLRADQSVEGGIGSTVPDFSREKSKHFADGTTWGAAVCMVPWQLYCQYGNTQIIEDNMEAMMMWLDGMARYPQSDAYPHLSSKASGLADWLSMDNLTPPDLVNNAIYIYMMEVTAEMARAINRYDLAAKLQQRHQQAKDEWNRCYVDVSTGKTHAADGRLVHSQSSYATPLNFNCFNEQNKVKAEAWLSTLAQNPSLSGDGQMTFPAYTITTGFSGTPNILPALSRAGKTSDAFRMFTCTDYTSWLYPVTKGATSVWERWNGYEAAFGEHTENNMNSFNHFALGAVGQWMYEYQLGITSGSEAGYKHFTLQPTAAAPYQSLSGSYRSDYGNIRSSWTADTNGQMVSYHTTVPANTTATLYLPINASQFKSAKGAKFVGITLHHNTQVARYELESGTYDFSLSGHTVHVK